jgi:hypothetical protein
MKMHPVPRLYRTMFHPDGPSTEPDYVVEDGRLRRTVNHRLGHGELPDYELRSDGRIYRTKHHPEGQGAEPDYEFRGDGLLYRSKGHPRGEGREPEYFLRE